VELRDATTGELVGTFPGIIWSHGYDCTNDPAPHRIIVTVAGLEAMTPTPTPTP
jgi:hypothetical protein